MVTIPRYTGSLGSAPIRSSRRITTGTAGSDALMNLGKTLTDGLSAFTEQKIAMTAKLRDQEIKNRHLLAGAETNQWIEDTKQRFNERNDYEMFQSIYNKDFEKHKKEILKKHFTVGDVVDEVAWNSYQADLATLGVTGKVEINSIASKKRNHKTITAYETSTSSELRGIQNAATETIAVAKYKSWFYNTFKPAQDNFVFANYELQSSLDTVKNAINEKKALFSISGDGKIPVYTNAYGEEAIDAAKVASELSDPTFEYTDIDNNTVSVNDPTRRSLIKKYQDIAIAQKNNDSLEKTKIATADETGFTNEIIKMKNGKADPSILDRIQTNKTLDSAQKEGLVNFYQNMIANDQSSDLSDTNQGKSMYVVLDSMVGSGAINYDNPKEMKLIQDAYIKNLLDQSTFDKLNNKALEVQTDKGKYIQDRLNRASVALARELGKTDIVEQMARIASSTIMTEEDKVFALSSLIGDDPDGVIIFEMQNNLEQIIREAYDKGMNIDNFIFNRKSPEYVIDNLVEVYNDRKFEQVKNRDEQMAKGLLESYGDFIGFGQDFRIRPTEYLNTLNYEVPTELKARDGETITEYFTRIEDLENVKGSKFGITYLPDTLDVSSLKLE